MSAAFEDEETLALFREEARDHLEGIEGDLLRLERTGLDDDPECVHKVFRAIHSIKGGAGFLGLVRIKELAHAMENLLNRMREREVLPTTATISPLLEGSDRLRALLLSDLPGDERQLITALENAAQTGQKTAHSSSGVLVTASDGSTLMELSAAEFAQAVRGGRTVFLLEYDLVADLEGTGKNPLDLVEELQRSGRLLEARVEEHQGVLRGSLEHLPCRVLFATVLDHDMVVMLTGLPADQVRALRTGDRIVANALGSAEATSPTLAPPTRHKRRAASKPGSPPVLAASAAVPPPTSAPRPPVQEPASSSGPTVSVEATESVSPGDSGMRGGSVRVHVRVLDNLMTLAGELVLARNQLLQKMQGGNLGEISTSSQTLSHIISDLQETVMATRMQSLSNVFGKFQRVVRDMARDLGKQIRLEVEGEHVELDKTVIEAIGDPLTHLVRNAVDHGVELPARREAVGKPALATVRLHAFHEAGKVVIEISDDGRGMDVAVIRSKALEKGLVEAGAVARMSEKDILDLVFMPGFSTAERITEISGRGVGLDVVRTNFTRLGGTVEIQTHPGKGTTMRVRLPLTLAIIPSLLVSVGEETFALPQANLMELVRIPAAEVRNRIERLGDALVMRLRGRLLPLVRLADLLGMPPVSMEHPVTGEKILNRRERTEDRRGPLESETTEERDRRHCKDRRYRSSSALSIAVLTAGDTHYGLVVDRLHESEEIVVKPLGRHVSDIPCYAGATILGDGTVAMILDVQGISRLRKLSAGRGNAAALRTDEQARAGAQRSSSLLVLEAGGQGRFAIPLSSIGRLEQVKVDAVEVVAGRRSMRYRGSSLLLLSMEDVLPDARLPDQDEYPVVVFPVGGREVGLLASRIVDVTESSAEFEGQTFRAVGILGSALLSGHTTLLVDLWGMVRRLIPDFITRRHTTGHGRRVLVADQSTVGARQLSELLGETGYQAVVAADGTEVLEKAQRGGFEAIVVHVDLAKLDGVGLAKALRDRSGQRAPLIALVPHGVEDLMERGARELFDGWSSRHDREGILDALESRLMPAATHATE